MSQDKPYLDSDLSLTVLANHLQINQRLLSEVINSQAEVSFYEYITGYRIEAFKQCLLVSGDQLPLINLAYDCGFGSKANFNHAFKKNTGVTPSQYRKSLQNQRER